MEYTFDPADYWLTRFIFQRAIGFIYLIGFLILVNQFKPLLGENGLYPVKNYLSRMRFKQSPSIFWWKSSDKFMMSIAWLGVFLSLLAVTGISDAFGIYVSVGIWFLLWVFYLSFVNVGQIFYGYGWEIMLLEMGFLTIFLGSSDLAPSVVVIWLLRWVCFRLMFGAGLIKIRGDACWRNLTCMYYHYETQPVPGPLSLLFHRLPKVIHRGSIVFNHFVELIVPFGFFLPAPFCYWAGGFAILFQVILILSGNLAWLNYITIVLALSCFDDLFFSKFIPSQLYSPEAWSLTQMGDIQFTILAVITAFLLYLSIRPVKNLISSWQIMNTSFDSLHLVNTYGAFGSITKSRNEIIISGTEDEVITENTVWKEYEFKGKPGQLDRRPPLMSPYHWRIDWQMWFAAMQSYNDNPWYVIFLMKLLSNDKDTLSLIRKNPFPDKAPKFIRSELYEYKFVERGDKSGNYWQRKYLRAYAPIMSLDNPIF